MPVYPKKKPFRRPVATTFLHWCEVCGKKMAYFENGRACSRQCSRKASVDGYPRRALTEAEIALNEEWARSGVTATDRAFRLSVSRSSVMIKSRRSKGKP
jgi:hypothetical protein